MFNACALECLLACLAALVTATRFPALRPWRGRKFWSSTLEGAEAAVKRVAPCSSSELAHMTFVANGDFAGNVRQSCHMKKECPVVLCSGSFALDRAALAHLLRGSPRGP